MHKSSRISGFYKQSPQQRTTFITDWAKLSVYEQQVLDGTLGLGISQSDHMIENAVGIYGLPLGIATNFLINSKDYLIPMVIEEPSVIAAVSNAARLFRESGGFIASSDEPIMIGQIQVLDLEDIESATNAVVANKAMLLDEADKVGGSIVKHGGGARDVVVRPMLDTPIGPMLIVHVLYDTRDAMGANAINTVVEHLASHIETITNGRVNLRILSNLTDQRKAYAEGTILAEHLKTESIRGEQAVKAIVEAGIFAEIDPYRAATHNKGIMNGVDAVVIATGNDWRAVEAGAHAYAARNGQYSSLTKWWQDEDGNLRGSIELPLALGTVGGATQVHPTARLALRILETQSARELSEICAAVGLAQNLAAIRALATTGIQHGHMRMHARQLAVAAGAKDEIVTTIAQTLIAEKNIRLERARALVQELNDTTVRPAVD
jgi:hydroxymethylglutaryl-CoA reductase